jgi:hypothetical protein
MAQDAVIVCRLGVHRKVETGVLLVLVRTEAMALSSSRHPIR